MFRGYLFGKASLGNIDSTEPIMQKLCKKTLNIANNRKLYCPDFSITCGRRSAEEQFELFKQGRDYDLRKQEWVKVGDTVTNCDGYVQPSSHQSGLAVDFCAWVDGKPNYDFCNMALIATCFFEAASDLGVSIDWGGSWRSISDLPHVEIIL